MHEGNDVYQGDGMWEEAGYMMQSDGTEEKREKHIFEKSKDRSQR